MKLNSQLNTILNDEIEKKKKSIKKKKIIESFELTSQTCDSGHEMGTT
jgi:hypothetical protein